jgi:hypothetical protein
MSASVEEESIQPGLATDLLRSQDLAVKMECDASTFDHKILDRALDRASCNPTNILVWMFLSSKNEDDFLFSEERQEQVQVQENGTSYREVTMAAPVAAAGNKRKR